MKKALLAVTIFSIAILSVGNPPAPAVEPPDAFIIKDIQYQSFQNQAKLAIILNSYIECVSYELNEPRRIIIDPLEDVYCDYQDRVYFEEGLIKSIEFVKSKEGNAGELYYPFDFLTVELREPVSYEIEKEGPSILLYIGERSETKPPDEELIKKIATEKEAEFVKELTETRRETKDLPPSEKEKIPPPDKKLEEKAATEKPLQEKEVKNEKPKEKKAERKIKEKETGLRKKEAKAEIEEGKKTDFDLTKELTLDECTEIALAKHLPLQIAKEQVELARLKVNESFRELFPSVSLLWSESRGAITDTLYRGRKYGFEFKQPLFHGGELYFTWEQAKVNLKITQENYNKEKENLIYEVAKAYYELAKALNNLDSQKELFKNVESDLEQAKKEYKLGLSTQLEFLNTQSSYDQVYYGIASAENSVSLKKLKLNKVMNIDISMDLKIDYKLEMKEFNIDLDECIELAMQERAELKTKELIVESAKLGEYIANSQTWPQLDVMGKYVKAAEVFEPRAMGWNLRNERFLGVTMDVPFDSHTFQFSHKRGKLVPTVTTFESDTKYNTDEYKMNFFDGLDRFTTMKNASLSHQQALSDFNDIKRDIHSEIKEAFYNIKEAQLKIEGALNNLQLYEKELTATKIKKELDEATISEVMDARIKFFTEKTNYRNAVGDIYLAIASLNKAIGIGGYFK